MRINKHKFNRKITEYDGIKFDSKKKGNYYLELKLRVKSGDVIFFLRQVPLHLPGNVRVVVDFLEFHSDGTVHFVDTKGVLTEKFIQNKKIVEALYPIEIEVV